MNNLLCTYIQQRCIFQGDVGSKACPTAEILWPRMRPKPALALDNPSSSNVSASSGPRHNRFVYLPLRQPDPTQSAHLQLLANLLARLHLMEFTHCLFLTDDWLYPPSKADWFAPQILPFRDILHHILAADDGGLASRVGASPRAGRCSRGGYGAYDCVYSVRRELGWVGRCIG